MTGEALVKRLLYFDSRGELEWRRDDNGGFAAQIYGVKISIRFITISRTREGLVLYLDDGIGGSPSMQEPFEKEKNAFREDMRKLYASAEKKALSYDELWEKLARRASGYDKL